MQATSKQFAIARVHPYDGRVTYRTGTSIYCGWTDQIDRAEIVHFPKTLKTAVTRERNTIKKKIDYWNKNPGSNSYYQPSQDQYTPYEYFLVEVDITYDVDVQKGLKL